jgi:hypothetical protein
MKKIVFLFSAFLFFNQSYSQYTVTKVMGLVKNNLSGEVLKLGSRLSDNDQLLFSSAKDIVRVVVAGKGIYIITPTPKPDKQQNALVEVLKNTLHIKSKEGYLSGRSSNEELIPSVLETEKNYNTKNLITKENKYLFNKNSYDISEGNKFFLQIDARGTEPIIRQLKTLEDTLIIYPNDFKVNGRDAKNLTYKIGFFSKEKDNSTSLCRINPYFDITGKMETIVNLIIRNNYFEDKEKLIEQCYAEVYIALGKPSHISFNNAFQKLYTSFSKNKKVKVKKK